MSKIIALMGRANSGKTTTISKFLPPILLSKGYVPLPGSLKHFGADYLEVYTKGSLILGITSSGDTYDLVNQRLADLVAAKCDTIVCACRTSGGTHTAIHGIPGYSSVFIQKTYAASATQEPVVNNADANAVYAAI
jgi:hypothetical protein